MREWQAGESRGTAPGGVTTEPAPASSPTDVVELRELIAAARSDEAEWRELVESMPQIVWITRPDGWHTHFNRKWTEFTGLPPEESLGFGWSPPFHPEDRDRAASRWEQATSSATPYEIEYRLRRADGEYHWMLGRATPLRDSQGRIVKWFGTCTDIEELKRAEAQLADQARLLDLARDAIVVHDLERCILHWNQDATRIHGWSADEAIGRHLGEIVAPDTAQVDSMRRWGRCSATASGTASSATSTGRAGH